MFRIGFPLAVVNCLVAMIATGASFGLQGVLMSWDQTTLWVVLMPAGWLLVAAAVARHDPTPVAYAVTLAALFCLLLDVYILGQVLWLVLPLGGHRFTTPTLRRAVEPLLYSNIPLTLTVLLPTLIGWWQRRRERLDDALELGADG